MMLSHAVLLAEARSYVAALADHAHSFDASMEYERVLLQLDWLHNGTLAPITVVPANDPTVLYDIAYAAISNLAAHDVDQLELEICLAMLDAAHALDASS
ncbi:MAG: hypothetical protein ABIR34_13765 [Marmoricola sp.]